MSGSERLSIGDSALIACLLEASAPKPGNVSRSADFEDTTFYDFAMSAAAIRQPLEDASNSSLGKTILKAVQSTQSYVGTNTNLGIILLLAPLAMVPHRCSDLSELQQQLATILGSLKSEDCRDVYTAIGLANPGGMGKVEEADVSGSSPDDLLEAMRLAESRDRIAFQYTHDFEDLFNFVVPTLRHSIERSDQLIDAIVLSHVSILAEFNDSLIARKCGKPIAIQASSMSNEVLNAREHSEGEYLRRLSDLDFWLRSDSNRRNPGTTADLVTAGLFILLRQSELKPPFKFQHVP